MQVAQERLQGVQYAYYGSARTFDMFDSGIFPAPGTFVPFDDCPDYGAWLEEDRRADAAEDIHAPGYKDVLHRFYDGEMGSAEDFVAFLGDADGACMGPSFVVGLRERKAEIDAERAAAAAAAAAAAEAAARRATRRAEAEAEEAAEWGVRPRAGEPVWEDLLQRFREGYFGEAEDFLGRLDLEGTGMSAGACLDHLRHIKREWDAGGA